MLVETGPLGVLVFTNFQFVSLIDNTLTKTWYKEKKQSSTVVEKYFSITFLHYSYIIKRDTNSKTFKNEHSP